MRRCQKTTGRSYSSTEPAGTEKESRPEQWLDPFAAFHRPMVFSAICTGRRRRGLNRFAVPAPILSGALSREHGLYALLLPRFQIERMPLDVLDDVLLQDLAFEAPQRAVQSFALVEVYFSQRSPHFYKNARRFRVAVCAGGFQNQQCPKLHRPEKSSLSRESNASVLLYVFLNGKARSFAGGTRPDGCETHLGKIEARNIAHGLHCLIVGCHGVPVFAF